MSTFHPQQISERAQHLLKLLVDRYIREGQPVGSRTLSREGTVGLSPATVRNVMADLEEMGLVCSPHASAGRVPTVLGYRLFVDTLLKVKPLNTQEESQLRRSFDPNAPQSQQQLLAQASHLLSEVTHFTGIVMLPRCYCNTLRHVEFLPLSDRRVLVILVVNEQDVQNRIIETTRKYSASELEQAANYLNAAFTGQDISHVREGLLQELTETRQHMDSLMQVAIEVAQQVFEPQIPKDDFVVTGQTNLMGNEEADVNQLRDLFTAFNKKRDILNLLDQSLQAQGVSIFIGEEAGYDMFDGYSMVTSPYASHGETVGVLGIVGPTRMPYENVIPVVDLTARLLGAALAK